MPDRAPELAQLIRTCVQCGLCLPHCATFLATGNEVQSPRGRLVLLQQLLEAPDEDAAAPEAFLTAFDQCIGCRACETVCPSGVPYELLAHGHHLAEAEAHQAPVPAVPGPVLRRLDRPGFLRLVGASAALARGAARRILGRSWRGRLEAVGGPVARLGRLIGSVPRAPRRDADLVALVDGLLRRRGAEPAADPPDAWKPEPAGRVQVFRCCSNEGLLPDTSRRLREAVALAGYEAVAPVGQDCCGALAAHAGRPGRAAVLRSRNQAAFGTAAAGAAPQVLVEAAGCRLELDPTLRDIGLQVIDPVAFLAGAPLPPRRAVPLRVAVHDPCHALGAGQVPRGLLARIPGLTWCEPDEVHVCCGSGGAWGLRYPEMSAELARRKARDLAATGADLVVTSNPGCLGQIADGLALEAPELPILPLTDLWWYAVRRSAPV